MDIGDLNSTLLNEIYLKCPFFFTIIRDKNICILE